jgi:membrane protein
MRVEMRPFTWLDTLGSFRQPVLRTLAPPQPLAEQPWPRRSLTILVRAAQKFWNHGNLFSAAAISFSSLFSVLPLVILMLLALTAIFPSSVVARNMGRLFGLADSNVVLQTIRQAYSQEARISWIGIAVLMVAAGGVFTAVQVALDRVWECRPRFLPLRYAVSVVTMAASLFIFVAMLFATVYVFRWIRTGAVGAFLGWPRRPTPGTSHALTIATTLAQFCIFWVGYRFLPNVPVRWREALPGAVVAAVLWRTITYGLDWYLALVADYTTLYHSLATILVVLVWTYCLSACFLFGAEVSAQITVWPSGRAGAQWQEPVRPPEAVQDSAARG